MPPARHIWGTYGGTDFNVSEAVHQMNRYTLMFVAALIVLIAGCSSASHSSSTSGPENTASPAAMSTNAAPLVNGQLIYQTGRDSSGRQIAAHSPPLYPNCAACHRSDGAGGLHLPGGAVSADLRHKALISGQAHPYDLSLVERAVATGIDNNGQPLNRVMPRWKLSKRDLHDVAYYVLSNFK
jgi:mono/diheme cytochrome c family protein